MSEPTKLYSVVAILEGGAEVLVRKGLPATLAKNTAIAVLCGKQPVLRGNDALAVYTPLHRLVRVEIRAEEYERR